MSVSLKMSELRWAYGLVSAGQPGDVDAYICFDTGNTNRR
jgi:hypothetical protein